MPFVGVGVAQPPGERRRRWRRSRKEGGVVQKKVRRVRLSNDEGDQRREENIHEGGTGEKKRGRARKGCV